jgi:hypothetical protein
MSDTYPVYPIYHVKISWPEEGKYCPDGRNATSATIMLREASATEIAERCLRLQERMAEEHNVQPWDVEVEISSVRFEEWACSWFSHYTFDIGLSDQEVLDSFRKYVWRIQAHNRRMNRSFVASDGYIVYTDDICLMGAEDEWRWRARANGTSVIGCGEETGKAPCRCDGCKKAGVVRIDH